MKNNSKATVPISTDKDTYETIYTLLKPYDVKMKVIDDLQSLINSKVKEAVGCIDCKKLRCENCERLWQT